VETHAWLRAKEFPLNRAPSSSGCRDHVRYEETPDDRSIDKLALPRLAHKPSFEEGLQILHRDEATSLKYFVQRA
jgi:hypothetical protein